LCRDDVRRIFRASDERRRRAQQGRRQAQDEVVGRLRDAAYRDRAGRYDRLAQPPGPGAQTVKSGALTLVYADDTTCQGRTYGAGESFVDRGDETVHTALNRGGTNLELWATYLVPGAPGTAIRINEDSPGTCPF
jgi:hypothetical protein